VEVESLSSKVLIVGAGPTGLIMAATLQRFGIDFEIIDKKDGLTDTSKGLSLNVSTQIVLSLLNLAEHVGVNGRKIRKLNLIHEKDRVMSVDFRKLSGDRYLITQPQSTTEAEIYDCLIYRGVRVQWSSALQAIDERDSGYFASIVKNGSEVITGPYRYVIGCEGKKSLVREKIGALMESKQYSHYFLLADFMVKNSIEHDEVNYIESGGNFFIIVPLSNNICRVVMVTDVKPPSEYALGNALKDLVNSYYDKDVIVSDAIWTSAAQIYLSVADKIQLNRLFICGDSFHLVSPIGGTGMNMGIQDAFNLGCKIAAVVNGTQDESVLHRYQTERLSVVKETCAKVDITTRMIFDKIFRDENSGFFVPDVSKRNLFKKIYPESYSGLSLRYPINSPVEINEHYKNQYIGCLFENTDILYSGPFKEKSLKPILIFNADVSSEFTVVQNMLSLVSASIDAKYSSVFHLINIGKPSVKFTGFINFPINCNLPVGTFTLITCEGIIEFMCDIDSGGLLLAYIECMYVKKSGMLSSVGVGV
jgi:2-polyprenyl-6-methoxyphenol hydroxylase-like FAD-dependent oxidoreductase